MRQQALNSLLQWQQWQLQHYTCFKNSFWAIAFPWVVWTHEFLAEENLGKFGELLVVSQILPSKNYNNVLWHI